jgi:hypothetical protein
MAAKLEDALRKVTELPGVKAALVFDNFNTIIARDVPGQYSNEILKRIASQLSQLALFSSKSRVLTQEFRLIYEKYSVYTRLFAKNFYLVVFMDRDLQPADFRQPLNLSVLVLDRALRSEDLYDASRTMSGAAEVAERSLRDAFENDSSFAGRFRRLCVEFLGQSGRDLVDMALEELYLFPPIRTEADMHRLRELTLSHIIHPAKRELLDHDSQKLLADCISLG